MAKVFSALFILSLILSCAYKHSYKTSDFNPRLQKQINDLLVRGRLPAKDTVAINYLRDSCSKEDLLKLIQFDKPLLRIIAYRTIVDRNYRDYFNILLNHLDDTSEVEWFNEDIMGSNTVSDFMIWKVENKLTKSEKDSLIWEILNKHTYLETTYQMIKDIPPQEKFYPIIKNLTQKHGDDCNQEVAIYALAKFKKENDVPLIKNKLFNPGEYCDDFVFRAIEVFPDTSFFEVLTQYFNKKIKKEKQFAYDDLEYYCKAVASYKNENSLNILTSLTKAETYPDSWYLKYNKDFVFQAVNQYNSPIYKKLIDELKPQMDSSDMLNIDLAKDFANHEKIWSR